MANPGLIKNALKRESWETLDGASTTNAKYNGLLGVISHQNNLPKTKENNKTEEKTDIHTYRTTEKTQLSVQGQKKDSHDKPIQRQSKIHKYEKT